MMVLIKKWIWNYTIFLIKMVNIMVYQNHRLENIDLVEKVDNHRDAPVSILPH
jgi:hypothetical protein